MNDEIVDKGGSADFRFLNKNHFLKICQGDPDRVRELAAHAIDVIRVSVNRLIMFLQQDDDATFLRELHKLKGSVGVIDPEEMYARVRSLEEGYSSLSKEEKQRQAGNLLSDLEHLRADLESLL